MPIFRRISRGITDPNASVLEISTSASGLMLGDFDNKDNVIVRGTNAVEDTAAMTINNLSTHPHYNRHDHEDDDSSISTNYSDDSSAASELTDYHNVPSNTSVATNTTKDQAAAVQQVEDLAQAILHDYQVKMDEKNENVVVSMQVPEGIDADQLQVEVDNGILRVRGETFDMEEVEDDFVGEEEEEGQLMRKISNGSSSTSLTASSTSLRSSTSSRHHRRRSSSVEQTFQLDEQALDLDNVTANFTDGVLTIAAPKKAEETAPKLESLPIHTCKPPRVLSLQDAFRVIVNIPGVHAEDIHVTYKQSKLCISAFRHFGRVRSFKRTIPVDTQKYQAQPELLKIFLHEGELTVIVPPKDAPTSSRLIEIQEE